MEKSFLEKSKIVELNDEYLKEVNGGSFTVIYTAAKHSIKWNLGAIKWGLQQVFCD